MQALTVLVVLMEPIGDSVTSLKILRTLMECISVKSPFISELQAIILCSSIKTMLLMKLTNCCHKPLLQTLQVGMMLFWQTQFSLTSQKIYGSLFTLVP